MIRVITGALSNQMAGEIGLMGNAKGMNRMHLRTQDRSEYLFVHIFGSFIPFIPFTLSPV